MTDALGSLTEKEKQTLRLIVRGHDAKSIARTLNLSVHTINERLRDARRKMAVSSSREAARLLLAAEGGQAPALYGPETFGDNTIGDDVRGPTADQDTAPTPGAERPSRFPILTGVFMTLALGLLALTTLPFTTTAPTTATPAPTHVAFENAGQEPASETVNPEVVTAARAFLSLIEQKNWEASYAATGTAFRKLNTLQVWTQVSEEVHARYGATVSRTLLSQQNLPAPPAGYEVVKFRTVYANNEQAVETVTLDREEGKWVVVGVTVG